MKLELEALMSNHDLVLICYIPKLFQLEAMTKYQQRASQASKICFLNTIPHRKDQSSLEYWLVWVWEKQQKHEPRKS